jgi:hypothetical protein
MGFSITVQGSKATVRPHRRRTDTSLGLRPDTEFFEPCRELGSVGAEVDLSDHIENRAVGTDDECPPFRNCPSLVDNTVGPGNLLARITQNRIVEVEGLGKTSIGSGGITAHREQGNVETVEPRSGTRGQVDLATTLELDGEWFGTAAGTQRIALEASAAGEGFGKPGEDDHLLAAIIGEAIGRSVTPGQLERRRFSPDTDASRTRPQEERQSTGDDSQTKYTGDIDSEPSHDDFNLPP